jgi:hypothetical protein
LEETDIQYEERLQGMLERNPPISDDLQRDIKDRLARNRERRLSSEESLGTTGDEGSPQRMPNERPHDYKNRLKRLQTELQTPTTEEEFNAVLSRDRDFQTRIDRGPREPQAQTPKPPDADLDKRIRDAQARRAALRSTEEAAERELITQAVAGSQDIYASSEAEAQRLFHTLDEMAQRGELQAAKMIERGELPAGRPGVKQPTSPPFRRDPETGASRGNAGEINQPFRGPERHMLGSEGPSQTHYNADFYFQGKKVTIHIFFPSS